MIRPAELKAKNLKVIKIMDKKHSYYDVPSGKETYSIIFYKDGVISCACKHGSVEGQTKNCSHKLAAIVNRMLDIWGLKIVKRRKAIKISK